MIDEKNKAESLQINNCAYEEAIQQRYRLHQMHKYHKLTRNKAVQCTIFNVAVQILRANFWI